MFDAHYSFLWRQLLRLGVPEDAVDDAAQELFVVAARRLGEIHVGSERRFLFGVARRVASDARRALARQRATVSDAELGERADAGPGPEDALGTERARKILASVLDEMGEDTREAFVLFELEGLSKAVVADILDIPEGTAASRLRRAREEFLAIAKRTRARLGIPSPTEAP
jgi:RNA polymerase sigma-70 factor (ECF subfamily)